MLFRVTFGLCCVPAAFYLIRTGWHAGAVDPYAYVTAWVGLLLAMTGGFVLFGGPTDAA